MKKLLVLMLLLVTIVASGATHSTPYDPGAARNTLSNVTPATGRAALGLGTMAVATATDYVATDTFTGHTNATGTAVHGLGTISTKADTDYVATSALALRLDTGNASVTEVLQLGGTAGSVSAPALLLNNNRLVSLRGANGAIASSAYFGIDANDAVIFGVRNSGPHFKIQGNGRVFLSNTPTYADNAAALAGGVAAGEIYRKADGTLMIAY